MSFVWWWCFPPFRAPKQEERARRRRRSLRFFSMSSSSSGSPVRSPTPIQFLSHISLKNFWLCTDGLCVCVSGHLETAVMNTVKFMAYVCIYFPNWSDRDIQLDFSSVLQQKEEINWIKISCWTRWIDFNAVFFFFCAGSQCDAVWRPWKVFELLQKTPPH